MENAPYLSPRHLEDLARLLDYPEPDFADTAVELCTNLGAHCPPEATAALGLFLQEVTGTGPETLEEFHTRTFSLAPICAPYIGVVIFGESNFKRGEFIAGLARDFEKHGLDIRPELPDHLGAMLRLAARLPREELDEMLTWCLCEPAGKMARQLESAATPYRHLIEAISLTLTALRKEMTVHA